MKSAYRDSARSVIRACFEGCRQLEREANDKAEEIGRVVLSCTHISGRHLVRLWIGASLLRVFSLVSAELSRREAECVPSPFVVRNDAPGPQTNGSVWLFELLTGNCATSGCKCWILALLTWRPPAFTSPLLSRVPGPENSIWTRGRQT